MDHCEAFTERYKEQIKSFTYQAKLEKHLPLFLYLTEKTGKNISSTYEVSELYFTLWTEVMYILYQLDRRYSLIYIYFFSLKLATNFLSGQLKCFQN